MRAGTVCGAAALFVAGIGAGPLGLVPVCAVGLFAFGIGTSLWDVAMNVEGAEVERGLGRAIMPRFHAAWSLGSITGAAVGVPMAALKVPLPVHFGLLGALSVVLALRGTRSFLPAEEEKAESTATARSAWLEPRTLAIGVMVLAFTVAEGSANDWLSLALIDGYDVAHWVGVTGYVAFVCAMTVGRVTGPVVLDRFGRARVLWASATAAASGSCWSSSATTSWSWASASWSGGWVPPWASRSASVPPPTTRPARRPGSRWSPRSGTAPSCPARLSSAPSATGSAPSRPCWPWRS